MMGGENSCNKKNKMHLMKKFLCIVGTVMLMVNASGQKQTAQSFFIGSNIPDMPLSRILNYKDSAASLSSFGEKLIILDFWTKDCGPCIASFPKMDSIQQHLKDKIQFILITLDSKAEVEKFLEKYNQKSKRPLSLPIIYDEIAIQQLFAHMGVPHMAIINFDGKLIMQSTGEWLLNADLLNTIATEEVNQNLYFKKHGIKVRLIKDIKPNEFLLKRLSENNYIELNPIYQR